MSAGHSNAREILFEMEGNLVELDVATNAKVQRV